MGFLGFMVILLVGGSVVRFVFEGLQNPNVVDAIRAYSPLLAEYSETIAWVSAIALMFIVLIIPLKLKMNEAQGRQNGMEIVGVGVTGALQGLAAALAILAVGYLAGVGWIIATAN